MRRHVLLVLLGLTALTALSGHAQDNASVPSAPAAPIVERGTPEQPTEQTNPPYPGPKREVPVIVIPSATRTATPPEGTDAVVVEPPPADPSAATPVTPPTNPAAPAPAPAPAVTAPPAPKLALLLPLKSKLYARAAEAVRDGFVAAAEQRPATERLPIWEYPIDDSAENLLATYARAVAEGARVIVGPLTREGVAVLVRSGNISVPTLALNAIESVTEVSPNLYMFALSLEAEARQAATLARRAGKCSAAIVYADSALGRRLQAAFADEWRKTQCMVLLEQPVARDLTPQVLKQLRTQLAAQPVDMVFIAGDADSVKRVRSYLKPSLPVYATSQVYRGKLTAGERREMRAVQFVDMPWLLQPDHPAVAMYAQSQPKKPLGYDLLRFYALGIDAQRISQQLLTEGEPLRQPMDGVSGRLTRINAHTLMREALPAVYQDDGNAVVLTPP
jgi:outer membrane PBP1 activator LpoA protein